MGKVCKGGPNERKCLKRCIPMLSATISCHHFFLSSYSIVNFGYLISDFCDRIRQRLLCKKNGGNKSQWLLTMHISSLSNRSWMFIIKTFFMCEQVEGPGPYSGTLNFKNLSYIFIYLFTIEIL